MSRFLALLGLSMIMLHLPAVAQEEASSDTQASQIEKEFVEQLNADEPVIEEVDTNKEIKDIAKIDQATYEERLSLARDMHDIWPIRPKIESALDAIAEQVPPLERVRFKAAMREAIKFKALEEASIDSMADIFTVNELKAMIAFYGSKEGRSVSFKTADYEQAMEPVMVKMIDKALLDVKLGTE